MRNMKTRYLIGETRCLACGLLLALLLALPWAAGVETEAAPTAIPLLLEVDGEATSPEAKAGDVLPAPLLPALQYRLATPNPALGTEKALQPGDALRINLFPDATYLARIHSAHSDFNGVHTVVAALEEDSLGYVILTRSAGVLQMTVTAPQEGRHFKLLTQPKSDLYQVLELDWPAQDILEDCQEEPPRLDWSQVRKQTPALRQDLPGPEEYAVIRVMVLYTPAARAWAGDAQGETTHIHNTVAQAMARANLTAANSAVGLHFEWVHTEEVDYVESGNTITDLERLTFYEGFDPFDLEDGPPWYMDEIHDWRDMYCADLVVLLTRANDFGGVAWLLTEEEGIPQLGFSITRVQQAALGFTMVHEMAHNLGAHHHKAQNRQPGPGLFPYAAGWRWVGSGGGRHASVMTYESGGFYDDGITHFRVPHFSNPEVTYQGVATGHPLDGDNARTIRNVKHAVAAYRSGCDAPDLRIRSSIPPDEIRAGDALILSAGDNGTDYLWFKDGMLLEADGRVAGVESQFLQIDPVRPEDVGLYQVSFVFDGVPVSSEPFEIPTVLEALPLTQHGALAMLIGMVLYLGFRKLRENQKIRV